MYLLAQVAPAAGCALIMVVCLVSMGAWRRWRAQLAPSDKRLDDPVEGLRLEVESLKEALHARDRSDAQS